MTTHYRSAGRTDIGKLRRRNEDAILVCDETGLWAVADGLGGHAAGDYASSLIVERLAAVPRAGDVFDFVESIEDTLADVNADLRHAARAQTVDLIGSTVVVLVYGRDFMLCGWVGDSRCYCHEGSRLAQITRDHAWGATDDADRWSGGPTQPQPGGGVLTRAVGAEGCLFVDWAVAGNRPGTRFVLCSDGVNKEMSDAEIEAACNRNASPDGVLGELFETSLGRAARDNLSAVIVCLGNAEEARAPMRDERLHEVNRNLGTLDDTHRLGEITRADYRARRRRLLQTMAGGAGGAAASAPSRYMARLSGWKRWWSSRRR